MSYALALNDDCRKYVPDFTEAAKYVAGFVRCSIRTYNDVFGHCLYSQPHSWEAKLSKVGQQIAARREHHQKIGKKLAREIRRLKKKHAEEKKRHH